MNFLTIEKFNSHSRLSLIKKFFLIIFLLVVPVIAAAAWFVFVSRDDFSDKVFSQAAASWSIDILAER